MILNNIGNATVEGKEVKFTEQSRMDWEIKSSDGTLLNGTLGASEFTEVAPQGDPPWSVRMGSTDFSRSTTVEGVTDPDAALSCLIVFPIPPNGAHIFVDIRK